MNDETKVPEADPYRTACPPEELPQPRLSYVLCEKGKNNKTRGGLHIPETASNPFVTVVAVGPGSWQYGVFVPTQLKAGDRILIDGTASDIGVFRWGEHEYAIIHEDFVKAVLPKEEPQTRKIIEPDITPGSNGNVVRLH
jgi:co-chaperonin GroES (HSP10)